ncbi:hypothetical protein [Legionella jordanis]|uniref:Membrane protein n=1 Tax=Legionella jordanis TaxID=456 RepID=A0A0W0VAG3_9GAMM|nr:hypothetical protein [Legionella jordanis]KTD17141.1 membrane protein [Legionella jordanis]RMX03266.1 hypothetical protein EAW55_07545 [Legionella jordanis]RMX18244.1 hypothetical protein EAS68_09080 [Legionella jordanis]VEH12661.1 membrane protein [Legionella jordanis]HAT8713266.1 hypothetical protein [Legionella jordanis]
MLRLGELLRKQGHFLLENDHYALLYIAILALIPFATWLSVAIVALITLRKGWVSGLKGLMIGSASFLLLYLTSSPWVGILNVITTFLPCFLMALALRGTMSWRFTMAFIVFMALIALALIHWLVPGWIEAQLHSIQALLKELDREGNMPGLLNNQDAFNPIIIANYVVGIQVLSLVLSATVSLMLARSVQARLFYPDGFRQEMLQFRGSSWGVIALLIAAIGAYQQNLLAISCLPLLIVYYVSAGVSLGFNVLTKGKGIGTLFLILLPLVILPFVMLPIYVILGALDSLFNFRSRLHTKAG